jgi:N-methylhydantoinase A/oxoprolinase/acetone carboxylase beta subunit
MERAVRVVTVEQGVDPRDLALVAFGGAGPLHACAIAEALEMRAVIVPPRAGVFSAVGLLSSPVRRELVRSWAEPASRDGLDAALRDLARDARAAVESAACAEGDDGVTVETFVDCRYAGQSHEISVRGPDDFAPAHERRNGFVRPDTPVEVVSIRARASKAAPLELGALPPVTRRTVRGPDVVSEPDCTVWLPDGWTAAPRALGAWVLERA